ncbi:MAG: serine/threonine protein kinase [Labilithrix sp.]|nr:serine/threonine protein kinase [Labilithrix sp.]
MGRYMVHRRIAAGGMATVHLGRLIGAGGFSRMVAIKRLHDGYARDPEFVAMLLDEARLTSTIRHPNVVQTLDVVAEEDELLVVMDYVEGDSLASLVARARESRERVPVELAASIVAQTLHGLHAAHEARDKNGAPLGIVHRDVSPQNVLVGTDGVARVLDFGIAKAASRSASTEGGQLKGKAAYMAPEQLQHGAVDRRTDVFAAAIVLWELLAGRRLFLGDSPAETMGRILVEPIDAPQRWAPDVPQELGLIALRGLERELDARFASAEEMALAIEDAIALPRAKEVGAWVARVASESIAARAELVRSVERESNRIEAAPSTDPELRAAMEEAERRRQMADLPTSVGRPAPSSGDVPTQWAMAANTRVDDSARAPRGPTAPPVVPYNDEPTVHATVRSASAVSATPARRVSRASLLIGIAGGVSLALALTVVLVTRASSSAPREDTPAAALATEAAPSSPLVAPPPTAPPAAGVVLGASVPDPLPAAVAPDEPPPTATPVGARAKKRRVAPRGSSGKRDCRVPYYIDDKGVKRFKVECL